MCKPYFFEDFAVGRVFDLPPRKVHKKEMIAFARQFDPQPFHLDELAAKDTLLEGLAASGWFVSAFVMRMLADGILDEKSSLGAPGVDEARWLKPVRADDILHGQTCVTAARILNSRPNVGLVSFGLKIFNQKEENVYFQKNSGFVRLRDSV